ncbi:MAG: hypothetical protein AAGE43_04185 [Pseudomonadota bacterium]
MSSAVLVLSIAYALIAALLLSLNIATRYALWVKAAAVTVVTGFYGVTWMGLNGMLGWATAAVMPEEFRVLWITMDEPDKATGEPGHIFFWVRELDAAGLPVGEPRAHRVPWSEESAESAQEALEQMEEGELLNGRLGRNLVDDEDALETGTAYAGERSVAGAGGERPDFEFVRVPPPALPAKALPD